MVWKSIAAAVTVAAVTVGAIAPIPSPSPSRHRTKATTTPHAAATKAPQHAPGSSKSDGVHAGNGHSPKPSASPSVKPTTKPTTSPPASPSPSSSTTPNGVLVNIAIFRAKITAFPKKTTTDGGKSTPPKKKGQGAPPPSPSPSPASSKPAPDPYEKLKTSLNKLGPLFNAWIVDEDNCATCKVSDAQIYVYGQETQAPGTTGATFGVTSFFANPPSLQRIDSASVPETTTSLGVITVPAFSADQLKRLVGRITLDENFKPSIDLAPTDAALQLVPSPVNATDPDYEPILENILESYGISSTRSHFSANALHGPSDPTTCPGPQRYFVYRVRFDRDDFSFRLQGRTKLEAFAEGFIVDCTAPLSIPPAASGDASKMVTTTSDFLTALAALAVTLKPAIGTKVLLPGVVSFSKIVDEDVNSTTIRNAVAATALERLAVNMCTRLLADRVNPQKGVKMPPALPTPPPLNVVAPPPDLPLYLSDPLICYPHVGYRKGGDRGWPQTDDYNQIYKDWTKNYPPGSLPPGSSP